MAKVGAQRAAELTGKSKSTVQRAMKSGKISYELDNNGRRVVDVAELERAFGLVPQETDRKDQKAIEAELEKATQMLEIERLKMKIRMLEEKLDYSNTQLEDLKEQRDQWQKQAQQTLLTSQYSQKQAEEYRNEIRVREQRARDRRQQALNKQVKSLKGENQNRSGDNGKPVLQGLWHKIRGQETEAQPQEPKAKAS